MRKNSSLSLSDYREQLRDEGIEKNDLCDSLLYWLENNGLPASMSELWQAFSSESRNTVRMAVLWLVAEGYLSCDPSKTRYRKYEIDAVYQRKKKIAQESKTTDARGSMLALDPTIISEDVANVLDEEIARLSAIKTASQMNKDHKNGLMISIQEKHVVVILTPQKKPYSKIREFLGRLDTMAQLDESLFFDSELDNE